MASIKTEIGQVLETWLPTQFKETKDLKGNPLPQGTIRVRFLGVEDYAYPADPLRTPVPLYGEQVICMSLPAGDSTARDQNKWYYTSIVNAHGNINNSLLPFLQDKKTEETTDPASPITKTGVGKKPEQISFAEKDIVSIQPFQGDTLYADRFGSLLRFSSTHIDGLSQYQNDPFWKGETAGDPFVSLTCGILGSVTGKSSEKYYTIESPKNDASFIYLTSTQYFDTLKFSQRKVGKSVKSLNDYKSGQVIIGSDRLVFDARKDEVLLISKKDVKIATPSWQTDMDEFFTQMLKLIEEVIKQNQNLEMAHIEIAALGINSATSIHPTGVGPSGPPLNTAAFAATNAAAITNAITTSSIRTRIEGIKSIIQKMKQ